MKPFHCGKLLLCLLLTTISYPLLAQDPPDGFVSATVSDQWNEVVGLTFTTDGQDMFVWERGGKVWVVRNNQRQLLLDISEEVGAWHDHGLLGFALHPRFDQNGHFYLLYLVDRHHLKFYGTGAYSPTTNAYWDASISRLTRYTATRVENGYAVVPGSRKILIGETASTGIPQLSQTHSIGSLIFGTDETLLVSTGDGASPVSEDVGSHEQSFYQNALADGIIQQRENVGAFRSQIVNSYNGKVLRIDPETGDGLPSNPFYEPANPKSPQSKVWALGFRNPFRMSLKPGTGSHNPNDGNPGILYVGDVGWNHYEEINVLDKPGTNFGWPIFEGYDIPVNFNYHTMLTANRDAPNPLYLANGCNNEFFNFHDLLKQATLNGTATFTNPCDAAQPIPAGIRTFEHTRPLLDWFHWGGRARVGTFNGQTPSTAYIGAAGSPVPGPEFNGRSASGGVFYHGSEFPAEYRDTYFFGDYADGWIRSVEVDANDKPVRVRDFVNENAVMVYMTTHPTQEGIYYVNFPSEIRKLYFGNNRPPIAVASADKLYGPGPLQIQFTGSASTDHENQPLQYQWDFGDGTPFSTVANPSHTFNATPGVATKYIVTLKVTDSQGESNQTSLSISVNNTPPVVTITSPANNTRYPLSGETYYELTAAVTDEEHTAAELSYAWQVILHHENHSHPNPIDNAVTSTAAISPLGCDGQEYYYRIVLTVTDDAGASATQEIRLYPDCESAGKVNPVINWAAPEHIASGTPLSATQLNATATYNGNTVPGAFTYTPPAGTILPVGNSQLLLVNFAPADSLVYNRVSKTNTITVLGSGPAFYRAINLNGPALVIDGNSWEASASAPGFSYVNGGIFANQAVTLQPATDASKATMIRSSIWGRSAGLALSGVPVGTYQIYLYVWEDNFAEVYSISVEGTVVQPNVNSGAAGTWQKLGPFTVQVTDGTINVGATGGDANLSGLEVWRQAPAGGNQFPVVTNPIPDQTAAAAVAYSFTFPANTFTDPDAGTVLTYTATLSDGEPLPAWLTFNATTRTFTGTPTAASVGTVDIRVTASDGSGGSVSDVFALTVSAPGSQTFYRAINLNGPALIIDGNNWEANASAAGFSYTGAALFSDPTVTLQPATDANRTTMIRSSMWGGNVGLSLAGVPAGTYQVYVYVWEDNFPETFSISVEGTVVQSNYNSGPAGTWRKLGPFTIALTDGTINVGATGGIANLSGLEIWRQSSGGSNEPPIVANPIADQTATVGMAYSFTFPANTFTDPNAGTVLSYAAALSGGGALPGWLTFNSSTRTFSGTPQTVNAGTVEIRVTASDGSGGSASDVFLITVNPQGTAGFYRAINLNGPVLTIDGNNWEASASAAGFTSTNGATFANQGVALQPSTDANRANMIRSSIWGRNVGLALSGVPSGVYSIYLYVWEDNFPEVFSISVEGTVVQANVNTGAGGTWQRLGPFTANITDGTINVGATGGDANLSGLEIWRQSPGGNQAPIVSNPIADQTTTVDQPYSYTFPANTFTDPDAGAVLTYTADMNGVALPAWLAFNAATRTFSGTPVVGNTGTFTIRVTASDGNGGAVSDIFALTVVAPGSQTFYRAINLNGNALLIDGNTWEASATASGFAFSNAATFANQAVVLQPTTDANRATMIRSSIWGWDVGLMLSGVPSGSYNVYLYVWEDNFAEVFTISVEGTVVQSNFNSGSAGSWNKLGPFSANITDGVLNVSSVGGAANLSGLEVWTNGQSGEGGAARLAASVPAQIVPEELPDNYVELLAYPNPFSESVEIVYTPRESAPTELSIFDSRGTRVRVLYGGISTAGKTEHLRVESGTIPDGVYILQLVNGRYVRHIRVAILR